MSIVRGPRPSDNYAQIHNAALADGRLSFKARGLLAYMLSRPPGWQTSVERLAEMGRDGDAAVKSGLRELEKLGYLRRHRGRNPDGHFTYDQEVTDVPDTLDGPLPTDAELTEPDTTSRFSTSGLSTSGKPTGINNTEPITLIKDDVVGSSSTSPTSRKRRAWQPSDAAKQTALDLEPITDINISIARYEVVKAEKKTQPDSAEWLRWFMEDEKKARREEQDKANSRFKQRKWFDVAE